MAIKFDKILGKIREEDGLEVPQYRSDNDDAKPGDLWVRQTGGSGEGEPMGILLSVTQAVSIGGTFELKYYTDGSQTISTELA